MTWLGWLGVVAGVASLGTVAFLGTFAWMAWIAPRSSCLSALGSPPPAGRIAEGVRRREREASPAASRA
jgi:hypothetical protein